MQMARMGGSGRKESMDNNPWLAYLGPRFVFLQVRIIPKKQLSTCASGSKSSGGASVAGQPAVSARSGTSVVGHSHDQSCTFPRAAAPDSAVGSLFPQPVTRI